MRIYKLFSHPAFLFVSIVLFSVFIAYVLPTESENLAKKTGEMISPDTQLFYTEASLIQMAEAYGDSGRVAYVMGKLRFDIAWPLVYGLMTASLAAFTMRRLKLEKFKMTLLFSAFAVAFDLLENTFVSIVFLAFPSQVPLVGVLAPWMTLLKWLSLSMAFLLPLFLLIGWILQRIKRRRA